MLRKLLKVFAGIQIAVMVMLMVSTPAAAADLRGYDDVIIASGDVVNDDLYVAGNRIIINGTVNGDVLAAGSTIVIDGTVNGDVLAFGSSITINGDVTGSARLGASSIHITGTIGDDLVVAGNSVTVSDAAKIGRDLVFGASKADVRSFIAGDIFGGSENLDLGNFVGGDAELHVNDLTIAATATINGNVVYYSDNEANIQTGAVINGDITRRPPAENDWNYTWTISPVMRFWNHFLAYLAVLLVGIVLVLIAPQKSVETIDAIRNKPWNSLGWGALVFFVTPIAMVLLLITIIGIPLTILAAIIWTTLIFVAQLVVGLFIGRWLLGKLNVAQTRGNLILALVTGFTILTLVKLIPVVGFAVWWLTVLFGIGAIGVLVFRRRSKKTAQPVEAVEVIES